MRENAKPREWAGQAACAGEDPELFFPIGDTGPALDQIEEAKMVCRGCAVAVQCLGHALAERIPYGVWGGMSEDERQSLTRRDVRSRRAN